MHPPHDDGDSPSEFAQRLVSHGMAVGVVDHLETIKVEHENGHLTRRTGGAEEVF